jgi:hypothetical protein
MCRSDEPQPYPVRSFTYRKEQARANEVHMEIVYTPNDKFYSDIQFNFPQNLWEGRTSSNFLEKPPPVTSDFVLQYILKLVSCVWNT